MGDSHGSRCERAPATGCKPSPSPSAVSQVTCPLPDSPSSSLREQGTWTEPAQKASRTKTSEVRWAGHPGGRGFPSPGVKVRVERATPSTRPALGESGHPARLGSPRGGSTQPPPSGRLEAPRGPADGVAGVPLTPSSLPSFTCHLLSPSTIPVLGNNNTDTQQSAAPLFPAPLTHPRSLSCSLAPPTGGPGRAPSGVLMRSHFREGGSEACLETMQQGRGRGGVRPLGSCKQPLFKEPFLRKRWKEVGVRRCLIPLLSAVNIPAAPDTSSSLTLTPDSAPQEPSAG